MDSYIKRVGYDKYVHRKKPKNKIEIVDKKEGWKGKEHCEANEFKTEGRVKEVLKKPKIKDYEKGFVDDKNSIQNVNIEDLHTSSNVEMTVDSESFKITVPSKYALQALAIAIEKGKKNVVVNMV